MKEIVEEKIKKYTRKIDFHKECMKFAVENEDYESAANNQRFIIQFSVFLEELNEILNECSNAI